MAPLGVLLLSEAIKARRGRKAEAKPLTLKSCISAHMAAMRQR